MSDSIQNRGMVNRRTFLGAIPAASGAASLLAAADEQKLAIDGGKPVRATRLLGGEYPGALLYDGQERTELSEAYDTQSLFRFYGPRPPRKVESFEKEFAAFMGAPYTLAVTSGTAALHVALIALGVGPGDEVILPAWTWHSCYTTIVLTGALPVFAEMDESLSIDPADIEKKITPQTKAVMVVHPNGSPANMDRIMALARKRGVKVLEDVAQSCGGQYHGKRLGTIGDIGTYSFQIHKIISAGEGGAVVTSNPALYERAIRFHDVGFVRPVHEKALGKAPGLPQVPGFVGTNYRMNEMTGAVMRGQLRKLETLVGELRRSARFLRQRIQDVKGLKLKVNHDPEGEIGWTINLLMPDNKTRNRFAAALKKENIPVGSPSAARALPALPYIANKVAPHPAWPTFNSPRGKSIRYGAECCPRTLEIFDRVVTLTLDRKWTESDLQDIASAVRKVHRAVLG